MPDPDVFAEFLQDHPRPADAMATAYAYFAGVAETKWQAGEDEWQARRQKNATEKRERIDQEQKGRRQLEEED